MSLNILGLAETRWTDVGKFVSDDTKLVYSGGTTHDGGVGVLLDKELSKCLLGYWAVSPRVLVIKIKAKPFNIVIIQVYAPTCDHTDDEVESFYKDMDSARSMCWCKKVAIEG